MACADADVLGALLAGELSAAERAQVFDHAASCERCRAELALMFDDGLQATNRDDDPAVAEIGPGGQVGRYVIDKRLGAGGMGVVYAAVDTELQRRVAVKVLRSDRDAGLGSQGRERLMREARTLARLSHPNVVTVFDVGVHGDHLFVAMEIVDGGSLSAWLRRAPRTTTEIVDRMCEAGRGLAAAHAAGVVHRDVKPDNILVGEDGRARMTDFGLARVNASAASTRALGTEPSAIAGMPPDVPGMTPGVTPSVTPEVKIDTPLTMTHAIVGTPLYMAPEQFDGTAADTRSDQWSFCATLYEAVAGVRPFAASELAARASVIAEGRIAEPSAGRRVPMWLRRIAQRGLRANPDERWPSIAAIVDALVRGRGRRRRAGFAIAGLAAVATGGIVVALARGTPDPPPDRSYMAGPDRRGPQCDCPYAICEQGCVGQCNAPGFTVGALVPGINGLNTQEILLGASPDGDVILYATGARCAADHLMLARRFGATFVPVDITDSMRAQLGSLSILEGSATLAADAQSIIIRTPDYKRFVRAKLSGNAVVSIDRAELADLVPELDKQLVASPVLSPDQLTLYFGIREEVNGDNGPMHGSYVSIRSDITKPFPRGQRMPGRVRNYNYITGVSADGLALFVETGYTTRVLMRKTTSEAFGEPAATVPPPEMYGWRTIPIQGCTRVLATTSSGGCHAEDILYLDAIPR